MIQGIAALVCIGLESEHAVPLDPTKDPKRMGWD